VQAARNILAKLVSFDTTSRNSNLALIEWIETFLWERGIASARVSNADASKANLYAIVGPAVEGGVVLSGHTDVVPVDGQPWSSDPWKIEERGGKLYGRGVADMKSFIALALAHVDRALQAKLKRPMILAFSYDEEVGCLGAPSLIARMLAHVPTPAAVIVGEPSEMKVVSGHKGIRTYEVEVGGHEAHSSLVDDGVSAVMEAVKLMRLVADMADEARAGADPNSPFSPPGATMTIGMVEGGTAANILARRCSFVWDLRCPPDVDPDHYENRFIEAAVKLSSEIKALSPDAFVKVRRRSATPGLAPIRDNRAEMLARALTGDNAICAVSYAAEAGLFQGAGWPVVICGPGSITQAHQPDEWIELSQLDAGAKFMRDLIAHLEA
jgi:acetylornithine deacetylase